MENDYCMQCLGVYIKCDKNDCFYVEAVIDARTLKKHCALVVHAEVQQT